MISTEADITATRQRAVQQRVPQNKWYLVPSPVVEVKQKLKGRRDVIAAKYDCGSRKGEVSDKFYLDDDRTVKGTLRLTTDRQVKPCHHQNCECANSVGPSARSDGAAVRRRCC